MNKETPVLLLTGYLGSGKTTLLNRILYNSRGIKFAVIVNDIGEVNIDADLIEKGGVVGQKDESLVALQNGCICCTLKMDLVGQLRDITRTNKFDYIVIEASGICEPEPIAQTICSIPSMGEDFTKFGIPRLDCIVTVVDALRMESEFGCGQDLMKKDIDEEDLAGLVIQQIEFCNIVLLNKASEISKENLGLIRQIVKTLQPNAEIYECDYGDVELDKLLNTGLFDFDKVSGSATWIQEIENPIDDDDDDNDNHHGHDDHHHEGHEEVHDTHHEDHDTHHAHGHHHDHSHDEGEVEEYGISTFVYYRRQPMDLNSFDNFVAKKWPKNVIRAKGMCYFREEYDICYLFEQAGKQFSLKNVGQWYATMPKEELMEFMMQTPALLRDWSDTYGDRMQKIVFIGQHLDKEALARELDKCLFE